MSLITAEMESQMVNNRHVQGKTTKYHVLSLCSCYNLLDCQSIVPFRAPFANQARLPLLTVFQRSTDRLSVLYTIVGLGQEFRRFPYFGRFCRGMRLINDLL